jgi:hypothetical protein
MEHFDGTALRGTEKFLPPELVQFLVKLESTASTDDVWDLILWLKDTLNLGVADYNYATDFRNWERAQFIRTTFDADPLYVELSHAWGALLDAGDGGTGLFRRDGAVVRGQAPPY